MVLSLSHRARLSIGGALCLLISVCVAPVQVKPTPRIKRPSALIKESPPKKVERPRGNLGRFASPRKLRDVRPRRRSLSRCRVLAGRDLA